MIKINKTESTLSYSLSLGLVCSVIILCIVLFKIFYTSGFEFVLDKVHTCTAQDVFEIIKEIIK